MYPVIKNASGDVLAVLNNITSNSLKRKVNADFTFDFKCHYEEFKTQYIQFGNLIAVEGQSFDISYIDESHSIGVEYDVKCEHVFYRLIGETLENYANTGTPSAILGHLLAGTEFSVGVVDFTAPVVFAVNQNTNKMSIILALVNSLGGEIDFSDDGFTINIKQTMGADHGYQIRIKKNLQSINKIVDRRGMNKATYKISLINVFKSDEMVLAGFENLETLGLGDKVRLIDETINVDAELYIVEEERDAIKAERINVVLGDSFEYLADKISFIETQAIKRSDIIYGVRINNDVGIEIERADKKARTKLNADEFRMQSGDGYGTYTDALYFDPVKGTYIFVGEIVGGTLNIGNGKFQVAADGTLTATGANISGNIDMGEGSTINWGQVNPPSAAQVGALPASTYIPTVPGYITSTEITKIDIRSPKIIGGEIYGAAFYAGDGTGGRVEVKNAGNYPYIEFFYGANTRGFIQGASAYLEIQAQNNLRLYGVDTVTVLAGTQMLINTPYLHLTNPTAHNIVAKFG